MFLSREYEIEYFLSGSFTFKKAAHSSTIVVFCLRLESVEDYLQHLSVWMIYEIDGLVVLAQLKVFVLRE